MASTAKVESMLTPQARLLEVAKLAYKQGPYAKQRAALEDYVRGDTDLLWALFGKWFPHAAAEILREAAKTMKPVTPEDVSQAARLLGDQRRLALVPPSSDSTSKSRKNARHAAAVNATKWLYRFKLPNGASLGDTPVIIAYQTWLTQHRDNVAFGRTMERVRASDPTFSSSRPVRDFVDVDEVEADYEAAETERKQAV